jgi:hypothetical protein
MANWKLKSLRDERRRAFLKMCGVTAAAIGLERSRLLNYLADEGGHGLAEAAGSAFGRALIVPCPSGSFAWMQELWPMPDMATQSVQGALGKVTSYLYCNAYGYSGAGSLAASQGAAAGYRGTYAGPKGPATNALGAAITYTKVDPTTVSALKYHATGDRPMFYSPDAPWFNHVAGKPIFPVSCFMSGKDETHTPYPTSATTLSNSSVLQAALASLGAANSSAVVPVLALAPITYGRAPGAPEVAVVPSAAGMIDLFNSAASQLALKSTSDQQLFETYFKALLAIRPSSPRSSWAPQLQVGKNAARIIGLNFASQLTPTQADLDFFGLSDLRLNYGPGAASMFKMNVNQTTKLDIFMSALIVVAKAFQLGLSKTAIVPLSPAASDNSFTDPHTSFIAGNEQMSRNTAHFVGKALDAFYQYLAQYPDPESTGETLDQNTMFVAYGDTPHDPLTGVTTSWKDATPNGCNFIYMMDPRASIKDGWFGQCYPSNNKQKDQNQVAKNAFGFSPITGLDDPTRTAEASTAYASTAAVFACAHGDKNKTAEYGNSVNTIPALIKV